MTAAFDEDLGGRVTAGVYRTDGVAEWGSDDAVDDWVEALGAVRERLVDEGVAELAPGVVAHRLVGAGERVGERVLILRREAVAPAWLQGVRLTDRQREVAELASHGATVDEVAAHCGISPHTVRQHLKHAYRKLGVANRVELARALRLLGA